MDELEDSLEREKKLRGDIEKGKRKTEGDLKLTQEAVSDLERNKKELEQTIQRKDKELASLTAKLEDEQALVGKQQKQIKELQVCVIRVIRFYSCALRVAFVRVTPTILCFSRESKSSKRKSKLKDKLVPRYNTVRLIFFNRFVEFSCNIVNYVYFVRRHCRPRNNVLTSPANWKSWANVWRKLAAPLPLKSSSTKNAKPK